MHNSQVVALVPMRHHSQRVPQKNFRDLAGKPLFHHILTTLIKCELVSQIVVDTDSPVISQDILKNFPDVIVIDRPKHLLADDVPMNDILIFDTRQVKSDLFLQTHSTNPLLKPETISKAIKVFTEQDPIQFDSLFSVTSMKTRLWDRFTKPINHDPEVLLQTQDLPPVYEENSCIYLFWSQNLVKRRNRIGESPMMFEIPPDEALDIDDEQDFLIADLLMRNRSRA